MKHRCAIKSFNVGCSLVCLDCDVVIPCYGWAVTTIKDIKKAIKKHKRDFKKGLVHE